MRDLESGRCSRIAFLLFVASWVALESAAPRVLAADAPAPPQVIVDYHDLDLSTAAGGRALLRRIEYAAQRVCMTGTSNEPLDLLVRVYECRDQAVARAVAQVHAPALTAAYRARYGAPGARHLGRA